MAKWLLAYIITLIIFPKAKPYVKDIIDNEYILDVSLGIAIFVVVIFLVLLVNKGISKAVRYTGVGALDNTFGLLFGLFEHILFLFVSFREFISYIIMINGQQIWINHTSFHT